MTIKVMFLSLVILLLLDIFITYKLYQSGISESDEHVKKINQKLCLLQHEFCTHRTTFDTRVIDVVKKMRSGNRKRRSLKSETAECKK